LLAYGSSHGDSPDRKARLKQALRGDSVHGKCHSLFGDSPQNRSNKCNDIRELHLWKLSHRVRHRVIWTQNESDRNSFCQVCRGKNRPIHKAGTNPGIKALLENEA
jgi:hypothetical protein